MTVAIKRLRVSFLATVMLAAIPMIVWAHSLTVSGGQDWRYLGYHYHDIQLAGFQFYGDVTQWTKDRTYEGIGRWNSATSKLRMIDRSYDWLRSHYIQHCQPHVRTLDPAHD